MNKTDKRLIIFFFTTALQSLFIFKLTIMLMIIQQKRHNAIEVLAVKLLLSARHFDHRIANHYAVKRIASTELLGNHFFVALCFFIELNSLV